MVLQEEGDDYINASHVKVWITPCLPHFYSVFNFSSCEWFEFMALDDTDDAAMCVCLSD